MSTVRLLSTILPAPNAGQSESGAGLGPVRATAAAAAATTTTVTAATTTAAAATTTTTTIASSVPRRTIPPYGKRASWVPTVVEDYGDGGAFPEILQAQYPLGMGLARSKSNALAVQVDQHGAVNYDSIARQGHADDRIIHTSLKDLIPLRQRAEVGELNLQKPSEDELSENTERTRQALLKLADKRVAAQKPKNVNLSQPSDPTFVRYIPGGQMGEAMGVQHGHRIIKIVEKAVDPMEPPKFRHRKLPRGPPSPPPPVMHSPPRKVTAKEQAEWTVPPSVSNWKNPKGYTIALDKRMAADGRGLTEVVINDKHAIFAEAMAAAERKNREETQERARLQQILAEKKKAEKEEALRRMAEKAREEREHFRRRSPYGGSPRNGSQSPKSPSAEEDERSEDIEEARERDKLRRERREEAERKLRLSRMGNEQKMRVLARERDRDISEKVALGLAKPSMTKDSMFDSRLYNRPVGAGGGLGDDEMYNVYDRPLFAVQEATQGIYRPRATEEDDEDEESTLRRVTKGSRFESLGVPKRGFKGAEGGTREGPVLFKEASNQIDDFGIDAFLGDIEKAAKKPKTG